MNNEIIKALVSYVSAGKITLESIKDKAQRDTVAAEIEVNNASMKKYEEEMAKKQAEEDAIKAEYEKKLAEAKIKMEEKKALMEQKKKEAEEAARLAAEEATKSKNETPETEPVVAPQNVARTKKAKTK